MLKYVAKRLVLAVVTIWAVATLTFFLMNMVPGGPFLSEKAISPQATAALEAQALRSKIFNVYVGRCTRRFWRQLKTEGTYRGGHYFVKVPGFCQAWGDFRIGCTVLWNPAWLYCGVKPGQVFGQPD